MRHVRDVLRLLAGGATQREIGESLNVAHSTGGERKDRAKAAGLSSPLAPRTDRELKGKVPQPSPPR